MLINICALILSVILLVILLVIQTRDSVRDSATDSDRDYVCDSVCASAGDSAGDCLWFCLILSVILPVIMSVTQLSVFVTNSVPLFTFVCFCVPRKCMDGCPGVVYLFLYFFSWVLIYMKHMAIWVLYKKQQLSITPEPTVSFIILQLCFYS